MFKRISLLGLFLVYSAVSHAAGFDCAKAAAPVEKTICAHPELNDLDEKMGRAYRGLRNALSKAEGMYLKRAQRAWLTERDSACGPTFDAECLLPIYRERAALLAFRLDPAYADSAAGKAGGEYNKGDSMSMQIQALTTKRVKLSINGADPKQAAWICQFSGEGDVDAEGALLVEAPEAEAVIKIFFKEHGARVEAEPDTESVYCGLGGALSGEYKKTRVGK